MNHNNRRSIEIIHAEISIFPIGTSSASISKEVTAAFDAIRKTKDVKTACCKVQGLAKYTDISLINNSVGLVAAEAVATIVPTVQQVSKGYYTKHVGSCELF